MSWLSDLFVGSHEGRESWRLEEELWAACDGVSCTVSLQLHPNVTGNIMSLVHSGHEEVPLPHHSLRLFVVRGA